MPTSKITIIKNHQFNHPAMNNLCLTRHQPNPAVGNLPLIMNFDVSISDSQTHLERKKLKCQPKNFQEGLARKKNRLTISRNSDIDKTRRKKDKNPSRATEFSSRLSISWEKMLNG
jgi:hypothetical protein